MHLFQSDTSRRSSGEQSIPVTGGTALSKNALEEHDAGSVVRPDEDVVTNVMLIMHVRLISNTLKVSSEPKALVPIIEPPPPYSTRMDKGRMGTQQTSSKLEHRFPMRHSIAL